MTSKALYIFTDESGDFNFTPTGTKIYTLTAVITHNPWEQLERISELRHEILAGEIHPTIGGKYLEDHLCRRFKARSPKPRTRNEASSGIGVSVTSTTP